VSSGRKICGPTLAGSLTATVPLIAPRLRQCEVHCRESDLRLVIVEEVCENKHRLCPGRAELAQDLPTLVFACVVDRLPHIGMAAPALHRRDTAPRRRGYLDQRMPGDETGHHNRQVTLSRLRPPARLS